MAIKELFFEGKTIEAAVEKAAAELGQDKDLLSYTVEETPTKGIFGIGATLAKIRVEMNVPEEKKQSVQKNAEQKEAPEAASKWEPEKLSKKSPKEQGRKENVEKKEVRESTEIKVINPAPVAVDAVEKKPVEDEVAQQLIVFVKGLLGYIGADEGGGVRVFIGEPDHYYVEVSGSKMGVLIGRRGETLDAVQYLCMLVINKGRNEKLRVTLDTEHYRAKRVKTLENLAEKNAEKALKYKRNITMEPMSPYERRIIHAALTDREHITTFSVGSEPKRRVVVSYKK